MAMDAYAQGLMAVPSLSLPLGAFDVSWLDRYLRACGIEGEHRRISLIARISAIPVPDRRVPRAGSLAAIIDLQRRVDAVLLTEAAVGNDVERVSLCLGRIHPCDPEAARTADRGHQTFAAPLPVPGEMPVQSLSAPSANSLLWRLAGNRLFVWGWLAAAVTVLRPFGSP